MFSVFLVNPICPRVFLSGHALGGGSRYIVPPPHPLLKSWYKSSFGMTFGIVILFNVTKKMIEFFFQNFSCRDDNVVNYISFFKKLFKK